MATDFSNHLITKATVILDQPSDWQNWIFLCKDSAQRSNLWAYVNPNVTSEAVFKLEAEKPTRNKRGFSTDESKRTTRCTTSSTLMSMSTESTLPGTPVTRRN
jgi:hypothetical protein